MYEKYTLYICTGHRNFYLSVPVQVTEQYTASFCKVTEQYISLFRRLNNLSVSADDKTMYLPVQVTEQYI
jgi:hypothetical protein